MSLLNPSPPFSDLIALFIQVGKDLSQSGIPTKRALSIPYPWRLVDAHLLSYNYKTCNHVIIHKRDNPRGWVDGWMDRDRGVQQAQLTIINIMTSHKSNPHNLHYLLLLLLFFFLKKMVWKFFKLSALKIQWVPSAGFKNKHGINAHSRSKANGGVPCHLLTCPCLSVLCQFISSSGG